MNTAKYTHRVVTPTGARCSDHRTEAAALKAARRLQGMGTKPAGFFRVEVIA